MKKVLSILSILVLSLFLAYNAFAANYAQSDNLVTVSATNVSTADDIVFQASAQVAMSGASEATSFAHAAHHNQALGKKHGRQFGMAADTSTIWWDDIEDGTVLTITATSYTVFSTAGWNKM